MRNGEVVTMKKTLVILALVPLIGACATASPKKTAISAHNKPIAATTTSVPNQKVAKASPSSASHHMNMAEAAVITGADAAWHLFPLFMNAIIP